MECKVENAELIDVKLEVEDEGILQEEIYETEKLFIKEEQFKLDEPSYVNPDVEYVFMDKARYYGCISCNAHFSEQSHLDKHILTHANDKACFKCNHCSKSYIGEENLIKHVKENHSKPRKFKVRYCKFCTARLSDQSLVELHRIQHAKNKAQLNCKMCDKVFKSRESLDMHLSMVHQVNNAYKCQECFKSFRLKSLLKLHKQTVHVPTQVIKY
ncbi:PREDICTED: zinc finger protein 809-like [Nicrophorus vespilloides]|uniref:Zinc finger protein 809-like n=1 Tax=Nicrophorus vespilloides TaxID=110193 RepID=A0ABM1M229_NICVS|nr:PREDICTED: zinc finger protein 809-like [Nicrophorus vespilloides]